VVGSERSVGSLVAALRRNTRTTVNFHPDRLDRNGRTVAEGLLATGAYLPQQETGISNGMRFAFPGGARTTWEAAMFGDAYAAGSGPTPIYGVLDLTLDPHGGSPRFGSCFVELAPHVFDRATFCFGDSHVGPTDVGTVEQLGGVLAALFEQAAEGHGLSRGLDVDTLLASIDGRWQAPTPARELDGYVEAQIHGGVSLQDDVDAIVLDPSFEATDVHHQLSEAAATFGFELRWHGGSELRASDVSPDVRGPTMPALAIQAARADGKLDAAALGRHARTITHTLPSPDGDPPDSDLQQIKYLWHCLVLLGADAALSS